MTAKLDLRVNRKALAGLGAALVLAGCGHGRTPGYRYFQATPDQVGAHPNSFGEAVIPRHGLIAVQGDDFAYGLAHGRTRWRINGAAASQSAITISDTLRKVVKGVRVENRGFPGDTAIRSAVRWQDAPRADLLILCLGYGDLDAHTSTGDFATALKGMVQEAQGRGTTVFLVLPPSFPDKTMRYVNAQLGGYRYVAAAVARDTGAEAFDATDSMNRIKALPQKTLAQPADVYQAVAADLVPYIKVVDAPPAEPASPQTGQAGSGDSRTVRVSAASAS